MPLNLLDKHATPTVCLHVMLMQKIIDSVQSVIIYHKVTSFSVLANASNNIPTD